MNVAVHQNPPAPIFTITTYVPELPPCISTHNKLASKTSGISALNVNTTATISFVLSTLSSPMVTQMPIDFYSATASSIFGSGIAGGMSSDGNGVDLVDKDGARRRCGFW